MAFFKIFVTRDFDHMSRVAAGIVETDIKEKQAGIVLTGYCWGQAGVIAPLMQVARHRPKVVSVGDASGLERLSRLVDLSGVRAVTGREGMVEVATRPEARMVVASAVGAVGLVPTYRALEAGKDVALANKETLVMAGELMLARARDTGARLLPIDSEHCALHECLDGRRTEDVRRLRQLAGGRASAAHPG